MSTDELSHLNSVVGISWKVFALCHCCQQDRTTEDYCGYCVVSRLLFYMQTRRTFWCTASKKVVAEMLLKHLGTSAVRGGGCPASEFSKYTEFPDLIGLLHTMVTENLNKFPHPS